MDFYDLMDSHTGVVISIMIIVGVLLASMIALPVIHIVSIGEKAEIEQLRLIVTELGTDIRGEDILGQVSEINQTIANYRAYNKIPIIQFWYPDIIAETELIEIPK